MKSLVLFALVASIGSAASAAPESAKSEPSDAQCNAPRKDGKHAARDCDLPKLCGEWVLYRKRIVEGQAQGDADKVTGYQKLFNLVNLQLKEYRAADVERCLDRAQGK